MGERLGARRVVAAAEDELCSHLDSGEKLLWAGRPAQGIVLTQQDWYLIPFSVVWLGFAVYSFWPVSTKTPEPLALFVAAGLLVFWVGLFMLLWRVFSRPLERSRFIFGGSQWPRHHLVGHASSLRAIDIFVLPQYFEARRAPGSQRHHLLRGSAIFILLARLILRPWRRHPVLPDCRCETGLCDPARRDAAAKEV